MSQTQPPLLLLEPRVRLGEELEHREGFLLETGITPQPLTPLQRQRFGSTLPKTFPRSHIPSLKSQGIWLHSAVQAGFFIPPLPMKGPLSSLPELAATSPHVPACSGTGAAPTGPPRGGKQNPK